MPFITFIPAGAFQTIRSAHRSSSSAASLAAGAPGLLAQARESRGSAAGLQRDLAGDTAKLLALKGELASAPDITPVINQVRMQGGFFASPRGVSGFQGCPVELRSSSCSPASPWTQLCQTRPAGELAGGIPDPKHCPPPLQLFPPGTLSCHFLYLQDTFNLWMRFLSFLLPCFVIAMETNFGVGCCGDHQPPLSAAGGTAPSEPQPGLAVPLLQ